jgi:hypothetical protein
MVTTTAIPGKTAFQVLEEYPDSGENIVDAGSVPAPVAFDSCL